MFTMKNYIIKNDLKFKNTKFLTIASIVLKTYAWLILIFSGVSGIVMMLGVFNNVPWWAGLVVLCVYTFLFFFFYTIAKISDLLIAIKEALENK